MKHRLKKTVFDIQAGRTLVLKYAPVWMIFIAGLYLIVLKQYGPQWEFVPGDLGDGRFNNYILEHFYRWITGAVPAQSYWDAPFFYPYPDVIAFSDNLLGGAPIYAFFRGLGASRETALQWWYLFGFVLNYAAAAYVLLRARLNPLAVGFGAFFFTFGIPLLAQGGHLQLYYRFGVPLACFFLLEFFNQPKLTRLAVSVFFLVWQFYLSIYLGLFLLALLAVLVFLAPCFESTISIREKIFQWPNKFKQAWLETELKQRIFSIFVIGLAGACFIALIWPYYKASKDYGLSREWSEISMMLPVLQSFLIADSAILWRPISLLFGKALETRHEQQLFPGMAFVITLLIGLMIRFKSKNSQTAWLYFWAVILLVIATLSIRGHSLYSLVWQIPGLNSIRAVTRIQMIWMWPLTFFAAWALDGVLQLARQKARWLLYTTVLLLTALLIAESTFFLQGYYAKADGVSRLIVLRNKLPEQLPENPILIVAFSPGNVFYLNELDSMVVAQESGWRTMNGYSGNSPKYYTSAKICSDIKSQIDVYTKFIRIAPEMRSAFAKALLARIVPVGFTDCGEINGTKSADFFLSNQ